MTPVTRITIHHEGAGNPVDWARGGEGGYSIWIGDVNGDHAYVMLRTPWSSWGTFHFNHVSLDICLSGNRMVDDVSDADILTILQAVADARARGWVVDHPEVVFHHDSEGSNTVCPGTKAYSHQGAIVAACQAPAPAGNAKPFLVLNTKGADVKMLQLMLNVGTGTHLNIDGVFAVQTQTAVKDLQRWFHLPITGSTDKKTWDFLTVAYVTAQNKRAA